MTSTMTSFAYEVNSSLLHTLINLVTYFFEALHINNTTLWQHLAYDSEKLPCSCYIAVDNKPRGFAPVNI